MGWCVRAMLLGVLLGGIVPASAAPGEASAEFTQEELKRILRHGPWPTPRQRDGSNRVSGEASAIALGERLFFDPRLSASGGLSCASCHRPEHGWTDGRRRALGLAEGIRNTPSVVDSRLHRWFGWDGAHDSLWSQSIRPLLDPGEMGSSAAAVARLVRSDRALACAHERVFGMAPDELDDEAVLVGVGKALAAFQETLDSGRTPFDAFRDALARGERPDIREYPGAARRGLKLFVGRAACHLCHSGPAFTNGEFHDIGRPFFVSPGQVDPGRHQGIRKVRNNRFNLLGPYNDDPARAGATGTRHVRLGQRNFGEFRVPSLRGLAHTAPYMHDGSLATLRDVIEHYSEFDEERLHSDGESILRPLRLSSAEKEDLRAFLETLSSASPLSRPAQPRVEDGCR